MRWIFVITSPSAASTSQLLMLSHQQQKTMGMEELSGPLENQENNFFCLICGSCVVDVDGLRDQLANNSNFNNSGVIKQLNVIFILKHLLQVPTNQLNNFLKKCGNPENWISLCGQCTQLTREAREVHLQIVKITRKLKGYQKLIVEKVKSSADTQGDYSGGEEQRSKVNKLLNTDFPKLTIWKETRKFVRNHNYDDLCLDDPIFDNKKLESTLPNNPINLEQSASPIIKTEPEEDNHADINNLDDFSVGAPTRPLLPSQDNPDDDDPSSPDWVPSPSSHNEDHKDVKFTPNNADIPSTTSKPKRIRNRHPPVPPELFTHQCLYCPLKFRFYAQVFTHMHSTHSISDYPCLQPNCSSVLTTIKKYSKHLVKYHLKPKAPPKPKSPKLKKEPPPQGVEPQPRVYCEICGGDFASKYNLKEHIKFVHEKSKIFKRFDVSCHLCGAIVKNVNMRLHLLRKHKDEAVVPQRKVKGEEGPAKLASLHKCPVVGCKIEYLRKEGLDKHMVMAHGGGGGGRGDDDVKLFQYSCMYCGKGFSIKRKLTHHEMVHGNNQLNVKPFKCDLCEKSFSTKKYLDHHKYYTHKLAKKYKMQGQS